MVINDVLVNKAGSIGSYIQIVVILDLIIR